METASKRLIASIGALEVTIASPPDLRLLALASEKEAPTKVTPAGIRRIRLLPVSSRWDVAALAAAAWSMTTESTWGSGQGYSRVTTGMGRPFFSSRLSMAQWRQTFSSSPKKATESRMMPSTHWEA